MREWLGEVWQASSQISSSAMWLVASRTLCLHLSGLNARSNHSRRTVLHSVLIEKTLSI